jgi:hypothetical protein
MALASTGVISLASAVQAEERAMHQVATAVSATTLSGYVDTSAIWKFGTGTVSGEGAEALPGRAFDGAGKTDGFNLHVVGLTLERPLGEEDWAAGYRVDLLFGPDAVGYNTSVNADALSDFGIKQAYVNLLLPAGNGIDVKMGVFNTIVGYESFESYQPELQPVIRLAIGTDPAHRCVGQLPTERSGECFRRCGRHLVCWNQRPIDPRREPQGLHGLDRHHRP